MRKLHTLGDYLKQQPSDTTITAIAAANSTGRWRRFTNRLSRLVHVVAEKLGFELRSSGSSVIQWMNRSERDRLARLPLPEIQGLVDGLERDLLRARYLSDLKAWVRAGPADESEIRLEVQASWAQAVESPDFPDQTFESFPVNGWLTSLPPCLRYFTKLERLDLGPCTCLATPPDLRRLSQLSGLSIDSYGGAPLDLRGLSNLRALSLTRVQASSLPDLRDLRALGDLYLEDCPNLTTPPDLRGLPLERLTLRNCSELTIPPDLLDLHQLSYLDLRGCSSMRSPPNLGAPMNLGEVRWEGCPWSTSDLHSIISSNPGLNAPFIFRPFPFRPLQPPPLPARVIYPEYSASGLLERPDDPDWNDPDDIHPEPFRVRREGAVERPTAVLSRLSNLLGEGKYPKVQFEGEPGVDAGGLKRDLWTLLGKSLFSEEASANFLQATKDDQGGWLPFAQHEEAKTAYRAFGRILAWGAHSKEGLFFPSVLGIGAFRGILAKLGGQDDLHVVLETLGDQSTRGALVPPPGKERSDEDWAVLKTLGEPYLGDEDVDWKALGDDERTSQIQQIQTAYMEARQGYVDATHSIIAGIRDDLGAGATDRLKNLSQAGLSERFFGKLDREKIQTNSNDPMRLGWLKNWIRDAPDEKLRRFLWLVTGSETLIEGSQLELLVAPGTDRVVFHTCFRRMDSPAVEDESMFRDMLEATIIGDSSFNGL
ncbi:MAG: hypothetical protein ACOYKZ_00315 [Chlamydiia bacterium]